MDARQVRSSLARRMGLDIGALPPTDRNVEGIVEVLLDATRNHAAGWTRASRRGRRDLGRAAAIEPIPQGKSMEWRPGTAALPGLSAQEPFEIAYNLGMHRS